MKLTNPTDDQLNAAFAEKVAGWRDIRYEEGEDVDIDAREIYPWSGMTGQPPEGKRRLVSRVTTSADAMLPWLEKRQWKRYNDGTVLVWYDGSVCASEAKADSFPKSAVIALLRAHGVEVEFTQ